MRKLAAGRPGIGSDQRWKNPQDAGQHANLVNPHILGDDPVATVEPGVALAQDRIGKDPEQRWQ
jgi:hypothetical protein